MTIPVAILMGMGIGGALVAAAVRNILHAVFGLAIALLACAGLFLYLHSPFVAAMEVLIYVGGISVAMVFAVMLSRAVAAPQPHPGAQRVLRAALGAAVFFALMVAVFQKAGFDATATSPDADVRAIGTALLTHYDLVFEALSVALLLAIIGAIAVAHRPGHHAPAPEAQEETP